MYLESNEEQIQLANVSNKIEIELTIDLPRVVSIHVAPNNLKEL